MKGFPMIGILQNTVVSSEMFQDVGFAFYGKENQ